QAQRHAHVVVVTADGAMRCTFAGPFERGEDRLLDAGLADRPGDTHDLRRSAGPGRTRQKLQGLGRIADQDMRLFDRAFDYGRRGTIGEGLVEIKMSVRAFAFQSEEQVPRTDIARVHLHARHLKRTAGDAADRRSNLLGSPQGEAATIAFLGRPANSLEQCVHDAPSTPANSAAHSRATVTSSNGRVRVASPVPTIWPCSCPFPATRTMSPAPASAMAARIAARRSPTSRAPGAPARTCWRIAAGSSPRGLSSVTITNSERAAATSPISARFPASRSPPAPNTVI